MDAAAAVQDLDFVPVDMGELVRHYRDYILGMVRKSGVPDQDAEDAAGYIIERLAMTDVIGQFDPEHVTEHQGKSVKTRFSTFLGAKVLLYCRGERGRIFRRDSHELKILDAGAGEKDAGGVQQATMHEVLLGSAYDDYSGIETAEFIAQVRARLAAVPPRSKRDTCDLVALFDELVAEIDQTGGFSYAALQARFGISGTTAGAWLSRLRSVLKASLGRPAVTVGGVDLTAAEAASALQVLRAAKGIMVRQPLEKAGHPLSKAEKGWYHEFAREEIRKFPALKTDPGTHRKPAGQVKLAVMHRLERVLAESGTCVPEIPAQCLAEGQPDPGPAPEATPEDVFEAALWRYLSDSGEMDRIKELARRAYAVVSVLWVSACASSSAGG
jgi:hypothetical protein